MVIETTCFLGRDRLPISSSPETTMPSRKNQARPERCWNAQQHNKGERRMADS